MPSDFDEDFDSEDWVPEEEWTDQYVSGARREILEVVNRRADEVFYERQLQLHLEKKFYHWITSRALKELVDEGLIQSRYLNMRPQRRPSEEPTGASARIRFFFSNRLRYWTRKAKEVLKLVEAYSHVDFTSACGHHAEMLFDAALPKHGFMPQGQHTREFGGRRWEGSDHDLDRIFVRDGVGYGAEIKNRLAYIDFRTFSAKLQICRHLKLRPLFIVRMMPKSYIHIVESEYRGFCLIFKYQLYPFASAAKAKMIRERLGLPVDCPSAIQDGTVVRFLNWHMKNLGRVP